MKLSRIIVLIVVCVSCKPAVQKKEKTMVAITIHAIGDSTMADKPDPENNPERGWVQMLPAFITSADTVINHAVNGRSTRSFINEKRWEAVYAQLKKGDYVFIQFGHNDQKEEDPNRYTDPQTDYRQNLIRFIKESRHKEAFPVLFTPIVRRNFNEQGVLMDTHFAYPQVVRLVAQEYHVPLIDLQYFTEKLEESYGVEASKKLHLHYRPGEIPYYPEGKEDDTHLSVLGATEVAKLAVMALRKKIPLLSRHFKME